jgi:hypothetical protein
MAAIRKSIPAAPNSAGRNITISGLLVTSYAACRMWYVSGCHS